MTVMDFELSQLTEDQRARLLAYKAANPPRLVSVGASDRLMGRVRDYLWPLKATQKQ